MSKLKQKLKSNSGVTLLFALMGFMAAAVISLVIVNAAVNSAETVLDDRSKNQAHLTLESAAQLVRDEMEGTACSYTVDPDDGTLNMSCSGTFSTVIEAAVAYIDGTPLPSDYKSSEHSGNFTISLTDSDDHAVDAGDVTVSFVMKASGEEQYDLTFTLSTKGGSSTQTLYLYMNGVREEAGADSEQLTWKGISISQVEQEYEDA